MMLTKHDYTSQIYGQILFNQKKSHSAPFPPFKFLFFTLRLIFLHAH